MCEQIKITTTDAIFEAVSGITTTGAECFDNLDQLPRTILYYHQQLQMVGGMGIVVLAVAIFPMLGMGGLQLFQLEASNPIKNNPNRKKFVDHLLFFDDYVRNILLVCRNGLVSRYR